MNNMKEVVRNHSKVGRHKFFFDNFFTSHGLLSDLAAQYVLATGTIWENRTGGANKELTNVSLNTSRHFTDLKVSRILKNQ